MRHLGQYRFGVVGAPVSIQFTAGNPGSMKLSDQESPFEQMEIWRPGTEELQKYVGTFYSQELGTYYTFRLAEGKLEFNHRKMESAFMTPQVQHQFDLEGSKVVFGNQGDTFTLSDGRVQGILFTRSSP